MVWAVMDGLQIVKTFTNKHEAEVMLDMLESWTTHKFTISLLRITNG